MPTQQEPRKFLDYASLSEATQWVPEPIPETPVPESIVALFHQMAEQFRETPQDLFGRLVLKEWWERYGGDAA